MSAETHYRLEGLEPDNLLAFMALLGLLRALETAESAWRPRAYWDETRHPLRPVLTLAEAKTREDVAEAAARGVNALARFHEFDRADVSYTREEARAIFERLTPSDDDGLSEQERFKRARESAVWEALISDGAVREKEDKVWPSPLCFLFGQGHQHFLDRLADVPSGRLPKKLEKLKAPPDLRAHSYIASALFASWRREDPTDGLRWDPAEDRRYALRADDPSGDPAGAQHGANRLAAIALPLFSTAIVARRGETRLLARACSYAAGGAIQFTWPLWARPASLTAAAALLACAELAEATPNTSAFPVGVFALMRAERISVGKFFNVTTAKRLG